MPTDAIKSYVSAADISDYWLKNFMPRYFEAENINTYRAGTLGLINEIMSSTTEDTSHAMMIARREAYPNTAQYLKSLYLHGASRYMDAPVATPSSATILLMIQQSELLKYGTQDGVLHTFVLDDTFIAYVDEIPYMLDYPIQILSVEKENGKYAHTTHYDFYIDNSLAKYVDRYLPNKVMNYHGTEYVIIAAKMRQIEKTYQSQLVTSNTIVSTVTMDFAFDGALANFEVFYKENDASQRVQLIKLMQDSTMPTKPFCWYKIIDEFTIRLTFPANAYFAPRLNSTISIEIATTIGAKGNFDSYASDIVSENSSIRHPYNAQVPVFGTVDGASTGGKNIADKEEFRSDVLRAYSTNNAIISVHDIQTYFDTLMKGTKDRFKFVTKRDDSFIRLYGAFLLMKDSANNVIPTNTLDVYLDPLTEMKDFDIYSEAVNRFIIKPGALFRYTHDAKTDAYQIRRIHDRSINRDISDYDAGTHWSCSVCGNSYNGKIPFEEILKDDESEYKCPNCEATKDKYVKDKFVFTNPYLISISTDNFMAGYFLNSKNTTHTLSYEAVNDKSIVQFIARHFKIMRNAVVGENFYRITVTVSPSIDIPMDTIFEARKETIAAKHNGYISKIEYDTNATYATIIYTSDPTLPADAKLTDSDRIQVSSYIEKVDKNFRVCPICGERMDIEAWETAKLANFMVGETPMLCPTCGADKGGLVADFEEKYIDFDYFPGFDMKFKVGDNVSKNDVLAAAKPKDLGRIRMIIDLGGVLDSSVHRYIPLTLEEAHEEDTPYFVFSAHLSTDDMIDSSMIMSILDGFAMSDGSSGHNQSIAIPINKLSMKLHAYYQYQEDDGLDINTRNPAHIYSNYSYMSMHTFTNTYSLQEGDTITLIQSLDHARGFLDEIERPKDPIVPPDPPEPPEPPDPNHPSGEADEIPDDHEHYVYLRTKDHERLMTAEVEDDRIPNRYLTTLKTDTETPTPIVHNLVRIASSPTPIIDNGGNVPPEDVPYGENFTFNLRNCPLIAANWIKKSENASYFISTIQHHYEQIAKVQWDLENGFSIDMKFYNSYGKSKFYKIGNRDKMQILDSVNIILQFGAGIIFPASSEVFRDNFRTFVKEFIEAPDDMVGNGMDLYIMNVIAAAKTHFDEIAYLEYYGLNDYDFSAQRLTIMSDQEILETVKADSFIPEFLNIVREVINGNIVPNVKLSILDTITG